MAARRMIFGMIVALMLAAPIILIGDNARAVTSTLFEEDFETASGISNWKMTVGAGNTGELSQAAYASPTHSMHIKKVSTNANPARATSPKIGLDYSSEYILSVKFLLPNATANDMLLVDDGRICVTVITLGATYLQFWCPTLGNNIPVSQGTWHWLTIFVHSGVGRYDVVLDGEAVSHNMGFKGAPLMSLSVGTNAASSRKVSGELYFDDIKYMGNHGSFLDNFDDGSISDWTKSIGTGSVIEVFTGYPVSPPYCLHVAYAGAKARATSPSIPCDFSSDYNVAFYFFEGPGGGPMIVFDDGRVELRQASNTLYYKNPAGAYIGMGLLNDIWPPMHKFDMTVHPGATPTPNFDLTINGTLWGTYPLKSATGSDKITLGTDPTPSKKWSGQGFWDDITVWNGPRDTDTDHDGISDQAEIAQGTDPNGVGKWAVIMSGGTRDSSQVEFEWQVNQEIMILHLLGFTDASIRVLSLTQTYSDPDGDGTNDIDMISSRANIQASMEWLATQSDADDVVVISLVDHGAPDNTLGATHGVLFIGAEVLFDFELGTWANQVSCRLMTVVIDCCNAGCWQDDLAGPGRMILMATNWGGGTITNWLGGAAFSEPLFKAIAQGESLEDAFDYACNIVWETVPPRIGQYPSIYDFDETVDTFLM